MANKERKHFTSEEKVSILRRHLIEKVPVSDLCEEVGLHPTMFYRWLKQFFENGAAAFQNHRPGRDRQRDQQRIAALEAKLRTKDEVLAELMEEHVALKKVMGRSERRMGTARHSRPGDRLRPPLEPEDRGGGRKIHSLAGRGSEQVLQLAGPLRPIGLFGLSLWIGTSCAVRLPL